MTDDIVLVCKGGCGKTTEGMNRAEFWKGKVEPVDMSMVPEWTCSVCRSVEKIPPLNPQETLQARIDYAFHIKRAGIQRGSEDDVKAICRAMTTKVLSDSSIVELDEEQVFPEMDVWGTDKQKTQKEYAEKMYDENWRRVKKKDGG